MRNSNVENSNQHENHQPNLEIPPSPDVTYDTKEALTNAIQAFSTANG